MADLVAFLRARLDERETKAKAALPGPWIVEEHTYETVVTVDGGQIVATVDGLRDGWHIADNNPAFVLANIDAKRQIIDECEKAVATARKHHGDDYTKWSPWSKLACRTLRLLAQPYAGHPDYDETWRP